MNKSEDTASAPVWNLAELLARIDNDQELLRDLLAIFKEDFPKTLAFLQAAVACGDLKNTASLSHTLKGMLSNLSAARAAAASATLEQLASTGEKGSLKNVFQILKREAASLSMELEAYAAEVRR